MQSSRYWKREVIGNTQAVITHEGIAVDLERSLRVSGLRDLVADKLIHEV